MKKVNNNFVKDAKLKPLSPTLRQKKRYVKFVVESERKFSFKEISEGMIEEILLMIGAIDFGKEGIWLLRDKFDFESQSGVLKVSTRLKDKLVGVLALISRINGVELRVRVIRVSGTLKGAEKKE